MAEKKKHVKYQMQFSTFIFFSAHFELIKFLWHTWLGSCGLSKKTFLMLMLSEYIFTNTFSTFLSSLHLSKHASRYVYVHAAWSCGNLKRAQHTYKKLWWWWLSGRKNFSVFIFDLLKVFLIFTQTNLWLFCVIKS